MIPKILHSCWFGNAVPSPKLRDCMKTQFEMHPDWQFFSWGDHNTPKLTCPLSSHAATANVVRLWALYEHGGIYMDSDVEVLKPFDSLLEHEAFIARQPDRVFCNAVMGATPKHPWIKWMLDKAIKEQKHNDAAWACHLVEKSPMDGVTVFPTEFFYSWNWDEKPKEASPNAYALHWWEGSWLK